MYLPSTVLPRQGLLPGLPPPQEASLSWLLGKEKQNCGHRGLGKRDWPAVGGQGQEVAELQPL